jgi:hypothetical protein
LEFRGVTYLIIDENLLLGPQLLRWIDLRCREIFPFSAEKPFGGNVFEEQMELSAENYFASVPKKKKKNQNQTSSNLPNQNKTKSDMQNKLNAIWLETARKRLMESRNRYQYFRNKRCLQYI